VAFKATKHANFCDKVPIHSSILDPWFGVSDDDHYMCRLQRISVSDRWNTHNLFYRLPARSEIKDDPKAYISALQSDVLPKSVSVQATCLIWHDWVTEFLKGT